MIEKILPAAVVSVEAFEDPPDARLFPAEEELIRRAVGKRRREFTTVRDCARRALRQLGLPPAPILPGERGAPGWPDGIIGSMTHCDGYRAAAVARAGDLDVLGIDAEPHAPLPDGVLDAVTVESELPRLARLPAGVHWDRLLFSAKESVYKAWFPVTRRWLGFEQADLTLRPDGTFTAHLLLAANRPDGTPLRGFDGRWLAADGLAVTTVTAWY